jgi:hypothetical protein
LIWDTPQPKKGVQTMAQPEQRQQKLTPSVVLMAMQRTLQAINEKDPDYEMSEPFPIEISELFLYSPDGANVLLVFPFLGQDFVLSETEISVENDGQVLVINDPLKTKILEYLVLRMRMLKDLAL